MELQLSMVVLEVRDLEASVRFYRALGLEIADPPAGGPVVVHRMPSGVSLLLTTGFASRYDPSWSRPAGGYQQLLEFYVGEDSMSSRSGGTSPAADITGGCRRRRRPDRSRRWSTIRTGMLFC